MESDTEQALNTYLLFLFVVLADLVHAILEINLQNPCSEVVVPHALN